MIFQKGWSLQAIDTEVGRTLTFIVGEAESIASPFPFFDFFVFNLDWKVYH